MGQLLGEDRGRWAQLGDVHLKNTVDSSIRLEVSKKSRHHLSTVVLRGMKGRGRAWRPIRRMEFTKTKTGGNGRKPHTRPFPFQFSCCRPGKFNRVLIFVWDAVSKWFPADRRRDALLSTTPSPPLSFSSIKIRRRDEPRVSFQSVMSPPTIQRGRFRC